MAVSLHTARIPFGLPPSVTSFTSHPPVISLPSSLTSVRYLPSPPLSLSVSICLSIHLSLPALFLLPKRVLTLRD